MAAHEERPVRNPRAWFVLLPSAILLAPVLRLLVQNGYGLLRTEALLWMAGTIAVGCVIGRISLRSRAWLRVLLLGGCLTVFTDLQFDDLGRRKLSLLALGFVLLVWLLREKAEPILSAGFGVLLLSILIVPNTTPLQRISVAEGGHGKVRADLPPVIVLILDEHIGLAGIPSDIEGGLETRGDVKNLYGKYGFRLYARAFSQYFETRNSLSNLFNFSARRQDKAWFDDGGDRLVLRRNALAVRARKDGYIFQIYQSDYIDLWSPQGSAPDYSLTYKGNSLGSVQGVQLPLSEKFGLIGRGLLTGSAFGSTASKLHLALSQSGISVGQLRDTNLVGPFEPMAVLDRIEADVVAGARGRFFLAHLMVPHFPYVYDADCGVTPETSSWLGRSAVLSDSAMPGARSEESRRVRYQRYFAQVRCLTRRLDAFFGSLKTAGVLEDAVIVVLGDHGSRINVYDPVAGNLGSLRTVDYVDGFSTLFAARGGGIEPGLEERPYPLVRAFSEVLGYRGRPPETEDLLLREAGRMELTPVPMPAF